MIGGTLQLDGFRRGPFLALVAAFVASVVFVELSLRATAGHVRHLDMAWYPFSYGEKVFRQRGLQREGIVPDLVFFGDSTVDTGLAPPEMERFLRRGAVVVSLGNGLNHPERADWIARHMFDTLGFRAKHAVLGWSFVVMNGNDPHVK